MVEQTRVLEREPLADKERRRKIDAQPSRRLFVGFAKLSSERPSTKVPRLNAKIGLAVPSLQAHALAITARPLASIGDENAWLRSRPYNEGGAHVEASPSRTTRNP